MTPPPETTPEPPVDLRQRRGGALRSARTAAGLSVPKLVQRVNDRTRGSDLTTHAVYAYERGKVLLGADAAGRLAAVLRVPVGELLLGDPDYRDTPGSPAEPPAEPVDLEPVDAAPAAPVSHDTLAWVAASRSMVLPGSARLLRTCGLVSRLLLRASLGRSRPVEVLGAVDLALDDAEQLLAVAGLRRSGRSPREWGVDQLAELLEAATAVRRELRRTREASMDAAGEPGGPVRRRLRGCRRRVRVAADRLLAARVSVQRLTAGGV